MYVSACVMMFIIYNYAQQIFSIVPQAAKNGGLGASTSTQITSKVRYIATKSQSMICVL